MTTQYSGPQSSQPYGAPYPQQAPYAAPHPGVAPPGYYAEQPAGYPAASGPAAPAPAVPTVAPRSVETAFRALLAQIGLSLIGLVAVIVQLLSGETRAAFGGLSVTSDVVAVGVVASIAAFALFNGLWALFAVKMRAGRNWARITITVFVALSILSTLINIASGDIVSTLVNVASAGLGIWAVVLMYRAETASWFAAR